MENELEKLLDRLIYLDESTHWTNIAIDTSMEKQIEIRAEIGRAIKRVKKEIER